MISVKTAFRHFFHLIFHKKAQLLSIIEEKSKKLNDPLRFQERINEIYLSPKIIELSRLLFISIIEEENLKNTLKHNKMNLRNLKHNYDKLHESRAKCNIADFTCLTFIELNKISKKNHLFFTFKQNPKFWSIIPNYFQDSIKNSKKVRNYSNHSSISLKNTDEIEEKILIGRHTHICEYKEEKDNLAENLLKNYIVDSVQISRDLSETSSMQESRNSSIKNRNSGIKFTKNPFENSDDFQQEFVRNGEERFSELSAKLTPNKKNYQIIQRKSRQIEHSVIVLTENDQKMKKNEENIEKINEKIYDEIDQEELNPRESILLLKNRKVYNNINEEVIEKYSKEIENSESFLFVNNFLAKEIIRK